ncbi:MAG: hypothetical protein C5B57_08785 [Blastocatellia bacterium]|nr:MAG: hypothetical protein C5B57_08785 [Blastocatellia bacterium]
MTAMATFEEASQALVDAAARCDRLAAWDAAGRLVSVISNPAHTASPESIFRVVWRGAATNRWFDIAELIAGTAGARTDAVPATRRLHAQMLMERGFTEEALSRLKNVLQNPALPPFDRSQALGHIGRIYKDRFITAANSGDDIAARAFLRESLDAYLTGYRADTSWVWLGINAVALLSRPESSAINADSAETARRITREILEEVPRQPADTYADATLAESYIALGDFQSALAHIKQYVSTPSVNGFALNNFQRQLSQVWRLNARPSPAPEMLGLVSAALLEKRDGVLHLSSSDVQRDKGLQFEAVFGADRFDSLENYRRGLERCSCVARIGRSVETGVGTGFVLPGRVLNNSFDQRFVLITNAHVISEEKKERDAGALHPKEAVVTFAAMDGVSPDKEFEIRNVLCSSPPDELDMLVAELSEPVAPKVPYSLAAILPIANSEAHVRIIGHPSGRGLSLSVNQLLDHQSPKLHYRTATEGGSSGSPVFNHEWKLIALHHAGGDAVPRLNAQPGTYQANEGIWIRSILEAIDRMREGT